MAEQIIQVLDALCEKFGIVIDWTAENVIPYLAELSTKIVNYEMTTSIIWIIMFSIPFIIFLVLFILSMWQDWIDDAKFILGFSMFIALIVFMAVAVPQTMDIVACLTFPEKIILRTIKALT